MTTCLLYQEDQFFDNSGNPLAAGKIYTYAAGTSTPLSAYTDNAGGTPLSNPIILSSGGRPNSGNGIWLASGTNYKFVVKTSADATIETIDNITPGGVSGTAGLILSAADASLPNARVLTASNGVTFTDGGAGSTFTLTVNQPVSVKSSTYTALTTDRGKTLVFTTGSVTLNLTAAASLGDGWYCDVVNTGTQVTIDPSGAELINGSSTLVLATSATCRLTCSGSAFYASGQAVTDATLMALAGAGTANKIPYFSATDTVTEASITATGVSLLGAADAASVRSTAGVGTIATQNSNSVSISGGSISGITDLAVADGGTGASDASTARTNLGITATGGLATGSNGTTIIVNSSTPSFIFPLAAPFEYSSGKFYYPLASQYGTATTSDGAVTSGVVNYIPIYITRSATFSKINCWCVTSSGNVNMAIFTSSGASVGSIVANSTSGSVATSSGAAASYTFGSPITLSPGLHFLACWFSSTPTMRKIGGNITIAASATDASSGTGAGYTGYGQSAAYTTTFPAVAVTSSLTDSVAMSLTAN